MLLHVAKLNKKREEVTVGKFKGEGMEGTRRGVEEGVREVGRVGKEKEAETKRKRGKGEEEEARMGRQVVEDSGELERAQMLLTAMSRTGVTHEKAMERVRRDRENITREFEQKERWRDGWKRLFKG